MITLYRTDSSNPDFNKLVSMLDAELSERDGEDHPFYAQFNKLDTIRHVIVAYDGSEPVGCGAFRKSTEDVAEIKRMFVDLRHRGKSIASQILANLEAWAQEENFTASILETGYNQPEAISLYKKAGYQQIPNYGPYAAAANSICFSKNFEPI